MSGGRALSPILPTFMSWMRSPRIDEKMRMPTRTKDICCDQNCTSKRTSKWYTRMPSVYVTGSVLPFLSKIMLIDAYGG